jgi:hypothetical protein
MTPERVALIARRERDLGITTRLLREHQRAGLRRR